LSFATSLFVRRTGWISAIFGFIVTIMIVSAIIATQSRGGLLGLMTVFAIVGSRVIKSKAVLAGLGAVAAVGLFAMAGISGRSSGGAAKKESMNPPWAESTPGGGLAYGAQASSERRWN